MSDDKKSNRSEVIARRNFLEKQAALTPPLAQESSSEEKMERNEKPSEEKRKNKAVLFMSNKNRVTIRVWLANKKKRRVGHTSLQTHGVDGIYASFWPDKEGRKQLTLAGVPGAHPKTPEQDALWEWIETDATGQPKPCPPDVEIDLYSLNVTKINEAYFDITALKRLADSSTKCNTITARAAKCGTLAALTGIGVANGIHTFDRNRKIPDG